MARLRPLLPSVLQPYFDSYIEVLHITETSVDRFIALMDSFRYSPPADFMEGLLRIRDSIRPIPRIADTVVSGDEIQRQREYEWERSGGVLRGPFTREFRATARPEVTVTEESTEPIVGPAYSPVEVEVAPSGELQHVELQRFGGTVDTEPLPIFSRRSQGFRPRDPRSGRVQPGVSDIF